MRPNSIDGERLCLLYVEFLLMYFLAVRNQELGEGGELWIIEGKKKQGQRFSFAPVQAVDKYGSEDGVKFFL